MNLSGAKYSDEQYIQLVKERNPWVSIVTIPQTRFEYGECQCVDCHAKVSRTRANWLTHHSQNCPVCSDGISYPNKYVRKVILQLPVVDVRFEYTDKWCKGKKYDIYFLHNGINYLIEVDGEQHYRDAWQTLQYQQKNDSIKDILAYQNGYKLIRTDCCIANSDYIRKSIENSYLSQIFDLTTIDWDECHQFATKNVAIEVAKYYANHKISIKELSEKFCITGNTTRRYLMQGSQLNICNYSKQVTRAESYKFSIQTRISKQKPFVVYDDKNVYVGTYQSIADCIKDLKIKYPDINFTPSRISNYPLATNEKYKGFTFKYECGLQELYRDNFIMHEVCEYYNTHPMLSNEEIGRIFKIYKSTVKKYLVAGNQLGYCVYDTHIRKGMAAKRKNKGGK